MFSDRTEIDTLADEEFAKIEQRVEKLLSVWEIKNLRVANDNKNFFI